MSWFKGMFFSRSYNEAVNCHPIPPIREYTHTPIVREPEIEPMWEPRHGNYVRRYVCHCGCLRPDAESSLCPDCGCVGSASEVIGRMEWEQDINYSKSHPRWGLYDLSWMPWQRMDARNAKWVKKGEGCGKEAE